MISGSLIRTDYDDGAAKIVGGCTDSSSPWHQGLFLWETQFDISSW